MVSVRKRGKVYEYRFETASIDGTRKWISKSGFPTKQLELFLEEGWIKMDVVECIGKSMHFIFFNILIEI